MRRLLPFAALLASAACFAPRPCTQALCPSRVDGAYEVGGWKGAQSSGGGKPDLPVVPDSEVRVTAGTVEFVNGTTTVKAAEGTVFRYDVAAKPAKPVSTITVSSGSVTVSVSSGTTQTLTAGSSLALPLAK